MVPVARATAPSIMSNALASRSNAPPQRGCPVAITTATSALSRSPITVSMLAVRPKRATVRPRTSTYPRTQ